MRCLLSLLMLTSVVAAGDPLPPANERFRDGAGVESPNFQRHVLPVMGRLGCNGRACHGSFQGQGGFRLSLFGYDFNADHDALLKGDEPRVDPKNPIKSLMLTKPTKTVAHKGGKRMDVGGWEYNLMLRWLKGGAPNVGEKDASFSSLEIEPREIVFVKPGETRRLKITARWSDGTIEDVTPLCRFRSNDESIATINEAGNVTSVGRGDTAAVAFYDNGVATVSILMPVTDKLGPNYPVVRTSTKVDELVVDKLRKLGIVPSDSCTDAEFLRRVGLDMTGTLPAAAEVEVFLKDARADKRARKIDELLTRPEYAAWWATRLCDFTGNNEANGPVGGEQGLRREYARLWYAWIEKRVRDNMSYDKLTEGIVLATTRHDGQTYEQACAEFSAFFRKDKPADFTARSTMPYFWSRRAQGKADERALSFAHAFLGVNLQCASCHKHPYDQWTKQDFDQFTLFFTGVRYGAMGARDVVAAMKKENGLEGLDEDSVVFKKKFVDGLAAGKVLPFKEVTVPPKPRAKLNAPKPKSTGARVLTPKLLGGEEVVGQGYDDPRQPIMDWLRDDDNPYFARAFVNRVWAGYFHAGLIDPPDDLNLANPPSNPDLLDYLTSGFIKSGYDMKWLHRTIALSDTYQRSWRPNDTNKYDERNLSRAVLRRLPAEVAFDSLTLATASDDARSKLVQDPINARAIGAQSCFGGRGLGGTDNYAVNLFGRPARSINCDCERSSEPSLLQSVYLRNDPEVLKLIDRPDGWLKQMAKSKLTRDDLIRQAYLRVLSRLPDDRELTIARDAELRDLVWVLVNTKEFIINR